MFTFNSTLGHEEATSYVSVAQADAYFATRRDHNGWHILAAGEVLLEDAQADLDALKESALAEASRHVDCKPLKHGRLFPGGTDQYGTGSNIYSVDMTAASGRQALKFPHRLWPLVSSTVTTVGASDRELICASLADAARFRDDYFNGGAVRITGGTGVWSCCSVEDFDVATGKITTPSGDTFSATLDTTSTFILLAPLPWDFIAGVCEQALFVIRRMIDDRVLRLGQGVASFSVSGFSETYGQPQGNARYPEILVPQAEALLRPYIATDVELVIPS